MSADNYIKIRAEGEKWLGYHQFASACCEQFEHAEFTVDTLEEAIHLCQSGKWAGEDDMMGGYLEYGFRVEGI